MADNLVRFGLSNVHYSVYTPGVSEAPGTYATPVALKGAVKMTTSPEGDSNTFYADNIPYAVFETNNGYTGTLEVAAVDVEFLKTALGYETDATSGLTYEATDSQPSSVALLFEIDGNVEKQRFVLYNVTFSRLDQENNTKSKSTDPDTVELNFTAIGRDFSVSGGTKNVVKGLISSTDDSTAAYEKFMQQVVVPGTAVE